jgi:LmbE family N-acetylglucosaminyl deacetylase
MMRWELGGSHRQVTILCLGAHSDDLEIGCGGTVLRLLAERQTVVRWVVFGCNGQRREEAGCSAEAMLRGAHEKRVDIHGFRDAFFPHVADEIKEVYEQLKQELSPDVIFTHARQDLHQDHRVVSQLTWNTFRDHLILEYEIPKYDGDLATPNVLVSLDTDVAERKIEHLLRHFQTQRDKRWFDAETFRGLMRIRGVEAGVRYAEGFYGRKLLV